MPTVDIFLGGTGVSSAVLLKNQAHFHRYLLGDVHAVDTQAFASGAAQPILGTNLLLAGQGFANSMQADALALLNDSQEDMWNGKQPVSVTVLPAGAETAVNYLSAHAGLYTLRTAGWTITHRI